MHDILCNNGDGSICSAECFCEYQSYDNNLHTSIVNISFDEANEFSTINTCLRVDFFQFRAATIGPASKIWATSGRTI